MTQSAVLPLLRTRQLLAGSAEKLAEAQREVAVLRALSHVNCLPLLGHAINASNSSGSGTNRTAAHCHEVLLVFPAYKVRCGTAMVRQCSCRDAGVATAAVEMVPVKQCRPLEGGCCSS